MTRVIRETVGACALAAVIVSGYAAGAAEEHVTTAGADELIVRYPTDANAHVRVTLLYRNSPKNNSKGGHHVVETDYGPVTVHIRVDVAETLTVVDWPSDLWPQPFEIEVNDGDEGEIAFVLPMM